MSYEHNGRRVYLDPADQLGFSLKPPKWLRKAQPGKILKKIALPIAAIGAAVLIPGAAPLALKAGGALLKFTKGGVMSVAKSALGRKSSGNVIQNAVARMRAGQAAAAAAAPAAQPMTYTTPTELTPVAAPDPLAPTATEFYSAGGGGGAAAMTAEQPEAAAAAGGGTNLMPLLIGGAVLYALSRRRAR